MIRKHILTKINHFLNENNNQYGDLVKLAKKYDYDTFISKTDSLTSLYNILYRGMYDSKLENRIFMTDYVGHAKEYGEYVDGIIYDNKDVLFFDDYVFNKLRGELKTLTKEEIYDIYSDDFKSHKLYDAMIDKYDDEKGVIKFVYKFIKSDEPYTKVQDNKIKNDLLIPIMLHYAKLKNKNIIHFIGGDYADYGGADEFVVNDISIYKKLSDIWKENN